MGQFFLIIMRSISITATITITLTLLAATTHGGVARRSIASSVVKSGKDLLSMKGASDAIKRSFKSAGKELEELSDKLEEEVKRLVKLSAYINETQAQKITDALAEAKNINELREKVNTILATLESLKGLVEVVKDQEAALSKAETAKDVGKLIEGLATDTTKTILKGTENEASSKNTVSIVQSAFSGIARFAVSLAKVLQRPDVAGDLEDAVTEIGKAISIINKQKKNMDDELTIIIQWRDAVEKVKNDVFDADLDASEEDLIENIKDIISDPRDVSEIYEAFGDL